MNDLDTIVKTGALSKIVFGVILGVESVINITAIRKANPGVTITKELLFDAGQIVEVGIITNKTFIAEVASATAVICHTGDELVTDIAGRTTISPDDFVITTTVSGAVGDGDSGALVGVQNISNYSHFFKTQPYKTFKTI